MADPVTGYFSENYRVPRRSLDQHMYQTRDRSDSIDGSNDSASQGAAKEDDSDSDSQDSNYSMLQAQEEWEENVRQLQLAVSVLILPTLGKWLGRRWAYSIYSKYIVLGWTWGTLLPLKWVANTRAAP